MSWLLSCIVTRHSDSSIKDSSSDPGFGEEQRGVVGQVSRPAVGQHGPRANDWGWPSMQSLVMDRLVCRVATVDYV